MEASITNELAQWLLNRAVMNIISPLLLSVVLTSLLSFTAPIFLLVIVLAVLSVLLYLPGGEFVAHTGISQILWFLGVFGSGSPVEGVLTIALACGIVGGLFTIYSLPLSKHY